VQELDKKVQELEHSIKVAQYKSPLMSEIHSEKSNCLSGRFRSFLTHTQSSLDTSAVRESSIFKSMEIMSSRKSPHKVHLGELKNVGSGNCAEESGYRFDSPSNVTIERTKTNSISGSGTSQTTDNFDSKDDFVPTSSVQSSKKRFELGSI